MGTIYFIQTVVVFLYICFKFVVAVVVGGGVVLLLLLLLLLLLACWGEKIVTCVLHI